MYKYFMKCPIYWAKYFSFIAVKFHQMKPKEIPLEHQLLMKEIGRRLKELRKTKGLSYIEFAEQIGVSRNSYNQLELGISNFQFLTLVAVLKHHDIELADFLKGI